MLLTRALLQSVVVLVLTTLAFEIATAAKLTGVVLVLQLVAVAHFLVFALATGLGANQQRGGIIVLAVVALLVRWPLTPASVVPILIAVACGVLVGHALQYLITDATRVRR